MLVREASGLPTWHNLWSTIKVNDNTVRWTHRQELQGSESGGKHIQYGERKDMEEDRLIVDNSQDDEFDGHIFNEHQEMRLQQ